MAKCGAFLATDISNCSLWLDAADSKTITLNGSDVAQWSDKSGNGNDVAQGVAGRQPAYQATGWTGSRPTVNFNGANILDAVSQVLVIPAGDVCIFTVTNPTVVNGYTVSQWVSGEGYAQNLLGTLGMTSTTTNLNISWEYSGGANEGVDFPALTLSTATDYILGVNRDVSLNTVTGYKQTTGGLLISSTGSYIYDPAGGTETYLAIGSLYGVLGGGQIYEGLISEVIIYQKCLTTDEARRVTNYLKSKWGI